MPSVCWHAALSGQIAKLNSRQISRPGFLRHQNPLTGQVRSAHFIQTELLLFDWK
jgi:hypothetical protein